jgi:hypothetical protein
MSLRRSARILVPLLVVGTAAYFLFLWTIARVEVLPDTFLVVTHRWGKSLPDGELVAPDPSYQGIQRKVLTEGRHFLNPLFYTYEVHPIVKVPEKYCAVLIRKSGREIDAERIAKGEFLTRDKFEMDPTGEIGERGIVEQVLGTGKYRLNPHEYEVQIVPAVEIESQQVGVKVNLWGREPAKNRTNPYVVNDGERGVQKSFVPSGTHYLNPYLTRVVPVDVRSHTVIFEDIEFPSKDGFTIEPRVQVRYKVVPEKAPELFVMLCENGVLYQKDDTVDDQAKNPILQKIILPLIRGYVRIEGSKHDAREYISKPKEEAVAGQKATNPRERLQEELMTKVRPECEKLGVVIDYIAVGQPKMNTLLEELAQQIREREQSRILRKTNEQKVEQFKQETELKSTEALAQRNKMVIDADTKLEQAKITAERRLQNEKAKIEAELSSAQERLEGSKKRAEAILTAGKAEANIAMAENEATVAELRKAIEGFETPEHFAQYHILLKLSPVLSEVFASDTSDFAKLFSTYLAATPSTKISAPAAAGDKAATPKTPEPGRK